MSETIPTERWLAEQITVALHQSLEAMIGVEPHISWKPSEHPAFPEAMIWWAQPLNVSPPPAFWIGTPDQVWSAIGVRALKAAGVDDPTPGDARDTYQEILNQALSGAAQAIGSRLKRDVSCDKGSAGDPPATGLTTIEIALEVGDALLGTVYVAFGAELVKTLDNENRPAAPESAAAPTPAVATQPAGPLQSSGPIDLLLDVELPVSVSFGRTQLPLKDVIKLTTGSIVELNRTVSEPVEIIVNNCVIARGEVVVIDGNYGVRINQIIPRQERLRTLY
jgi:flagellar motor switch protein FliN